MKMTDKFKEIINIEVHIAEKHFIHGFEGRQVISNKLKIVKI